MIHAIIRYYPENSPAYDDDNNDVIDYIQESLECCGVNSIDDWERFSPYYTKLGRLPPSCCGREEPSNCTESEAFNDVRQICHHFMHIAIYVAYRNAKAKVTMHSNLQLL